MVGVFRRSLSFPNKISQNIRDRPSLKVRPPMLSRHARSISLPTRSHPFIFQLKDLIDHLQSFKYAYSYSSSSAFSAWLCEGLTGLKDLHHCLDDTLRLPQTQEALRRLQSLSHSQYSTSCCSWVNNLLEQSLRFVDIYGILRTSVLALKQDHSAAQVALRKRDDTQMALYVKARKRMAKEMIKLVNEVRYIGRPGSAAAAPFEYVGDIMYYNVDHELASVMSQVVQVTVTVSLALFKGIAAALSFAGPTTSSSKSTILSSTWSWMGILLMGLVKTKSFKAAVEDEDAILKLDHDQLIHNEKVVQVVNNIGVESFRNLRKKGDDEVKVTLKKMQELEASIAGIETCSETVFRSLINARVSLLNTLTLL